VNAEIIAIMLVVAEVAATRSSPTERRVPETTAAGRVDPTEAAIAPRSASRFIASPASPRQLVIRKTIYKKTM
jgi:hypothetical protein